MFESTETVTDINEIANQEEEEQEQSSGPINFDWNDPALAEEEADQVDPDQDADEFPPPPPDAIYTCNWDFVEPDEDKRWVIRQGKNGKFLMTQIVGTIVDCDDQKIPERRWINRKVRTFIHTIVGNDNTSSITDFEKALGLKAEVVKIKGMKGKPEQFQAHRAAITEAIIAGAQGKVAVQWQGSYKRTDGDGKAEYVRPGGKLNNGEKIAKDHPIQNFRGMKSFPFKLKFDEDLQKEVQVKDDAGVPLRSAVAQITDPDDGEVYEVRAGAEIRTFIPKRG